MGVVRLVVPHLQRLVGVPPREVQEQRGVGQVWVGVEHLRRPRWMPPILSQQMIYVLLDFFVRVS